MIIVTGIIIDDFIQKLLLGQIYLEKRLF